MSDLSPGSRLRQAVEDSTIQVPGAFNALVAKLAEQSGFEAVYLSGAAFRPAPWLSQTSAYSR